MAVLFHSGIEKWPVCLSVKALLLCVNSEARASPVSLASSRRAFNRASLSGGGGWEATWMCTDAHEGWINKGVKATEQTVKLESKKFES